ncbi:MAG: Filamentous hemagglutinin N-terminal protein, partial [Gammaproteobacteria bacterium]|nr:Filamentous hemagglutinin N-terminal protein [Gammaproteobacteria bacterium]
NTNLVLQMDDPNNEIQILVGAGEATPEFSSVVGRSVDPSLDTSNFVSGGSINIGALSVSNQSLGGLVQSKLAKQAVLAGNLIGLQQLAFIDVSLFEEDLALYGTIGQGIALALEQCEEIEGCAPDVTEQELNDLIEGLQARIAELERRLTDPEHAADKEKIEELLVGYRKELENYNGYLKQLQEYYAAEEETGDEFGEESEDDFGDEFGASTIENQIRSLSRVLEVAKKRIDWLEQLKANADERTRLSTVTGIELTIEALDEIIDATNQEIQFIEAKIKQLQDSNEAGLPNGGEPQFWAEAGDNSLTGQVYFGPALFNADEQVLAIQTSATGAAWY